MSVWNYSAKLPLLVLAIVLTGCAGSELHTARPNSPPTDLFRFNEGGDFISAIRRKDIVSGRGFDFQVTFYESNYKKYIKSPSTSLFTVYVNSFTKNTGENIQIRMCSLTEVCVQKRKGGAASGELYRTDMSIKDGSYKFTIPASLIPSDTDMERKGVLIWAHGNIDDSLWRVTLSNSWNAVLVPTWPGRKFPPKYINYRNFLEIF